ncbi:hypothetical protein SJAG_03605 [Schizosaccharomyces japonicus yFS275]|uniref:Uncharacterized protein n=1 Tax=Schizosaccharomyces japonicus (strain yFS275 / FY16936) TaxID=402676 RepID=B6K4P3_SCHJY|nr:hypothetical protein SJAG_03605 [Schizosaccharomyces japonicus yFS275]EEB08450.1 hypothetical protein SJAG_03605 [Schizosaccharomyces japonicus yFS275]
MSSIAANEQSTVFTHFPDFGLKSSHSFCKSLEFKFLVERLSRAFASLRRVLRGEKPKLPKRTASELTSYMNNNFTLDFMVHENRIRTENTETQAYTHSIDILDEQKARLRKAKSVSSTKPFEETSDNVYDVNFTQSPTSLENGIAEFSNSAFSSRCASEESSETSSIDSLFLPQFPQTISWADIDEEDDAEEESLYAYTTEISESLFVLDKIMRSNSNKLLPRLMESSKFNLVLTYWENIKRNGIRSSQGSLNLLKLEFLLKDILCLLSHSDGFSINNAHQALLTSVKNRIETMSLEN